MKQFATYLRVSTQHQGATGRVFNYKGEKTARFVSKYAGILDEVRDENGVQYFAIVSPWAVTFAPVFCNTFTGADGVPVYVCTFVAYLLPALICFYCLSRFIARHDLFADMIRPKCI